MRAFAMTGIVTASWISRILSGSAMRATPPSSRMSAGTRSSAMTATASAAVPPGKLGRVACHGLSLASAQAAEHAVELLFRRRDRPQEDGVLLGGHDVVEMRTQLLRGEMAIARLDVLRLRRFLREGDRHRVPSLLGEQRAVRCGRFDGTELGSVRLDLVA